MTLQQLLSSSSPSEVHSKQAWKTSQGITFIIKLVFSSGGMEFTIHNQRLPQSDIDIMSGFPQCHALPCALCAALLLRRPY